MDDDPRVAVEEEVPAPRAAPVAGCQNDDMEPRISLITLGVADLERSYRFYKDGFKFPTTRKPENGIVFFQTVGVTLALFPYEDLAGTSRALSSPGSPWLTTFASATRSTTCLPLQRPPGGSL